MRFLSWGIYVKTFLFLLLFGVLYIPQQAPAQENDYAFYKKYGHSSKQWDEDVKKGFEAYDQQNCETVLTSLKQAIAAQCQDPLVYYKLAVCSELNDSPYTAMQYYQLAEEKLQKLSVIHPYQRDIYENFGRALFKSKKYNEAFPYLTRAAAIGTPSFGLYYMVGYLFSQKGDMNAALNFYNKAVSMDYSKAPPTLVASLFKEIGKAYLKNKDYNNAVQFFDKAIQLNPQDQETNQLRAEAKTGLGQLSIINLMDTLSGIHGGGTQTPKSLPPPPAASKLPPLETQPTMKDPMPPMGTVQTPGVPPPPALPPPSNPSPSTPMKLEPLPPAQP